MSAAPPPGRSTAGARAWRGAQALLAVLLAVGAAALAVDLSDWRYWRVDLSASRRNSLDPAVLDVIDGLPEPVVVDVFFRPLAQPYTGISLEAQGRTLELLSVAHNERRNAFDLRVHDPKEFEETQARQSELGIEGDNRVVLSCGARRTELELFGELCVIDWGNPKYEDLKYLTTLGIAGVINPRTWSEDPRAFRPAQFQEFRGEELLAQALLKVASSDAPKVYFAVGHGEPDLDGRSDQDLGKLRSTLQRDGFEIGRWDATRSPAVPADCDVLALIGAHQPYQEGLREAVLAYAEGGGRVLLAPDLSELQRGVEGGIVGLLRSLGIVTLPGVVCQAIMGADGLPVEELPQCALLVIDDKGLQPSHALTEPLRRRGRRVQFRLSSAFEGASVASAAGVVLPLVTSPPSAWRDLATGGDGRNDFRCNPADGERRERQTLVVVKDLKATKDDGGTAVRQGRVLAVASAYFFENVDLDFNRDFVRLAFNYLAERDYRMAVAPLEKSRAYLDFERSNARPVLVYTLWLGLPGLCAVIGALVFLRRRA